jgi:hypothetical protein
MVLVTLVRNKMLIKAFISMVHLMRLTYMTYEHGDKIRPLRYDGVM